MYRTTNKPYIPYNSPVKYTSIDKHVFQICCKITKKNETGHTNIRGVVFQNLHHLFEALACQVTKAIPHFSSDGKILGTNEAEKENKNAT